MICNAMKGARGVFGTRGMFGAREVFGARGILLIVVAGLIIGMAAGVAEGGPSTLSAEPVILTLSEVLAAAREHGPGFAQARWAAQSRELDLALGETRTLPTLTVTGQTDLHPSPRQNVSANVQWQFHDDVALTATVGRTWDSDSPSTVEGGRGDDRVTLSFSRKLWPPLRPDVERQIEELERRRAELDGFRALNDAHVQVIDGFNDLDQALRGEKMAETRLELARAVAQQVEDGFARGDRGLKEWQDAQQGERQALVDLRRATTARVEAATRLQRLTGDAASHLALATTMDFSPATLELHDDLAWNRFIHDVGQLLVKDGEGLEGGESSEEGLEARESLMERFLAADGAYIHARLAELQAVQTFAEASSERNLQWHAEAAYTLPLSSAEGAASSGAIGSSGAGGSAGIGGPSGTANSPDGNRRGHLTAFIGATWQWHPGADLPVEKARLAVQFAEQNTRNARQDAEDGVAQALRALDDAAFALDVARLGVEQARALLDVVEQRVEFGFAGPLELAQAKLDGERAESELVQAHSALYKAWLDVARRLGRGGLTPW